MELTLYTVVHPIGPDDPYSPPDGWRWAIHTDQQFDRSGPNCVCAGWEAGCQGAEARMAVVVYAVRRGLLAVGATSKVVGTILHDCPLNANIIDQLAVLG